MTDSKLSTFSACPVRPWKGRYSRVPGDSATFHVRVHGPVVDWVVGQETAECPMVPTAATRQLAAAVINAKRQGGEAPGGAFLINEYGQVLAPVSNWTDPIAFLGEWTGPLWFQNQFSPGTSFDLSESGELRPGEEWHWPYVGMPYNLSKSDEIYYWHEDLIGGRKLLPDSQDRPLIARLRELRPYGPVRFLVSYPGLVLTKVPVGRWPLVWKAAYVGRLDFDKWFPKEE